MFNLINLYGFKYNAFLLLLLTFSKMLSLDSALCITYLSTESIGITLLGFFSTYLFPYYIDYSLPRLFQLHLLFAYYSMVGMHTVLPIQVDAI